MASVGKAKLQSKSPKSSHSLETVKGKRWFTWWI